MYWFNNGGYCKKQNKQQNKKNAYTYHVCNIMDSHMKSFQHIPKIQTGMIKMIKQFKGYTPKVGERNRELKGRDSSPDPKNLEGSTESFH